MNTNNYQGIISTVLSTITTSIAKQLGLGSNNKNSQTPNQSQNQEDEANENKTYIDEIVDYLNAHKGQIGIIYVLSRQEAGMLIY